MECVLYSACPFWSPIPRVRGEVRLTKTPNICTFRGFLLNLCRVTSPLMMCSRQWGSWMLMSSNLMQSASDAFYLIRVPHGAISVAVKAVIGVELPDRDWLICAICEPIAVRKFSSNQGSWKCLCGTPISHLEHFFNVSSKKLFSHFMSRDLAAFFLGTQSPNEGWQQSVVVEISESEKW